MSLKKSDLIQTSTELDDSDVKDGSWHLQAMHEMNDELFEKWCDLVEIRTGMRIAESRRSFLLSKLSIRMREIKCDNYQHYYDLITDHRSGFVEWETLVDRLTVHETRFGETKVFIN